LVIRLYHFEMDKTKEDDWSVFLTDLGYDTNNPGDKTVFDAFKGKKSTPGDLVAVWVELGAKDVKDDLSKRGLDDDAQTRIFSGIRKLVPKDKTVLSQKRKHTEILELELRLSELERKILLPQREAELVFDSHNKYSFQKVIHRSAMSIVVSASCHHSNKPVVVKLLKKEKDFQHEFQILRTLGGRSHTIRLLDTISCSGFYAGGLVFTQYESASKFIPSSRDELNLFMVQLLKAISYCHSKKIIHRDIKKSNIFYSRLTGRLQVFLGDFGLATQHSTGQLHASCGTMGYIAPEVLWGPGDYDFSADMWSVGVVFAELLFGRQMFSASSAGSMAICFQQYNNNPHQYLHAKGTPQTDIVATKEDEALLVGLLIDDVMHLHIFCNL